MAPCRAFHSPTAARLSSRGECNSRRASESRYRGLRRTHPAAHEPHAAPSDLVSKACESSREKIGEPQKSTYDAHGKKMHVANAFLYLERFVHFCGQVFSGNAFANSALLDRFAIVRALED